ncbi:MAG TPA: sulfite exporter TauE/SafE family protein [Burkholderiales bacterium]|nr:sulfite exporter TauE/SafE family protein [Burkholderiales bacterium]
MPEVPLLHLFYIGGVIFAAYVVRGISGFGTSLVAMPLLTYVLPVHAAAPLMNTITFVLLSVLFVRDFREVAWPDLRALVWPALAGVALGLYLLHSLDNQLLLKFLGGLTAAYGVYVIVAPHLGWRDASCSRRWALPAGSIGGFIDAMFGGGGGTAVVVYMHLRRVTRAQFRATLSVLWLFEMIALVSGNALAGFYSRYALLVAALMLPLMWAGTHVGERVGKDISHTAFTRFIAVLLMLSGGALLLR